MCLRNHLVVFIICIANFACAEPEVTTTSQWSKSRANAWYARQPWLVGSNFIPSTAINQLEMWQADTFDPATIDRELQLAAELGFTSMRVFLHNILWEQDRAGLLQRIETYLEIADRHGIGTMFVLFDSVWDPYPKAGKQPEPRPRVMGSAWVQAPGAEVLGDPAKQDQLRGYVTGVISHFADDRRVQIWDICNEPDNENPPYRKVELPNKKEAALRLVKKAFGWAREVNPMQPLTSGVWTGDWSTTATLSEMEKFQLENSDVISFHSYEPLEVVRKKVGFLKRYGRPILCTEYMARPLGSTFNPILGYFQEERIGAYNWGLVLGKTQTNYPWDSWDKEYTSEPELWFHDIFRGDGTPYKREEVDYIRQLTGKSNQQ